jgi:ligand-binding sensor domain-containing protein
MQKWILIVGLCLCFSKELNAQEGFGPVGSWLAHFSNESIQQVIKGDQLYVAAANQVLQIDANQNISALNTTNGLHSIGVHKIAWHPIEKQLVIAYQNSRVDIVQGDQVTLIDDIQVSNLFADKGINDLRIENNFAYLSCNFGIVVIDLLKKEIKETIFPNNNRQTVKVTQTIEYQNKFFALTENGIWSCTLGQYNNWVQENTASINGIQNMFVFKNQLFFNTQQAVYAYQSNTVMYKINKGSIQTIHADASQIYAGVMDQNKGMLVQLNADKTNSILVDTNILINPVSVVTEGNAIWIADNKKGLYIKNTSPSWIKLGGPLNYIRPHVAISNQQLLLSYDTSNLGMSSLDAAGWTNYNQLQNLKLSRINALSIDPVNQSWWMGMGNQLLNYSPSQNTITQAIPNAGIGHIQSIQQKADGSMTLLKEGLGILIKEATSWTSYPIPSNFSANNLKQLHVANNGLHWVIGPSQQGVLLFQKQNNQGSWRQLNTSRYAGNLPSMEVTAIAEDKEGTIWLGTDNGIGLFQCGNLNEPCDAFLPIVESNGFNGYLFQKETIHCISVDGANRKWIGTNNGAWLVSKDGTEVLEHFTTANSPLPNDKVYSIAIDPTTGTVFFFTANEIISYKGNATEGATRQSKILIYPNPVGPAHNGPIVIKNLVENALVKITTISGQLVASSRALGGQTIWDGRDSNQRKVASGIYLVFVRDDAGKEKAVGKIVITAGR